MTFNRLRYVFAALLILGLIIPAAGVDAGQAGRYIVFDQAPAPAEKIVPAVRESMAGEEFVEVLVKMTGQVNTGRVARDASRRALPGKQGRAAVRTAVVDELQAGAAAVQKGIALYLEQEQRRGNVREYRGYFIVNMLFVEAVPAVVEQLARRDDVNIILPNSEFRMDPPETVETGGFAPLAAEWGLSRVNAPAVWDLGFTGAGVVVGVIDSGVYWQHEALKTKWRGYNPADPYNPAVDYNWYDATLPKSVLPKDVNGHGTHVTGTILGAAGANRIGVAPGASWIAARVFDDSGKATGKGILNAGEYMIAPTDANGLNPRPDLAPDVINSSWGSETPGEVNPWFQEMVRNWRSAGILPVFAAGNDGDQGAGSISNPANYPESFAVAATDDCDELADFSSRGPGYAPGIKPEISAPGVYIRSSIPGGNFYGYKSGTSMAAPHISGVAALLLSAEPNLSVDDLERVMMDSAIPLTDTDYPNSPNYGFGYGLVNALAAVNSVNCGGPIGDLDGNGLVNVIDAVILLRYSVSLFSLTPQQLLFADANGDGHVTLADVIVILRYIAGLVEELPALL